MKSQHVVLVAMLLRQVAAQDPAQFVNPFVGTTNGGHVFPGATLPWGSIKPGADSRSGDNQAGYVSDESAITGISQLHDDGTGGSSSLGHFALLPFTKTECAENNLTRCTVDRSRRALGHGKATASPGYFGIPLNNGVNAEVTVTEHAAIHRFTYTPGTDQLLLLLDITNDLAERYQGDGKATVSSNPKTNGTRITGTGRWIPSFGQKTYQTYFCFDAQNTFEQAMYYETSAGRPIYTDLNRTGTFDKDIQYHGPAGVLLGFAPGTARSMSVRMGVSWTSTAKACAYAEEEIPDIAAFDTVRSAARAKWNQVLGTVELDTTGVSADTLELFWTSLYRTYIAPTNVTGDNPLWSSAEPYYDSFYCIWDTFRVVHPLYAITAPNAQAEIIRAVIDIYRNTGWLPDCRMSTNKGFTQGGSNADSLLSDSYVKGITAGIDWEDGFKAMVKDATEMGDFEVQGRGGINSREKLGFIPVGDRDHPPSPGPNTRSGSRLLEYAYNDFSIALVAQGLNKPAETAHYFNKSGDWYNIWNPNATHYGFSGFIQPRNADGSWHVNYHDTGGVFRPDHCSPVYGHDDCYLGGSGGEFYEASSWEYSFYVPHDMASLVRAMGGPETFSSRLDTFFTSGFHDMGDEPGFMPTYLYNYVGQPAKTAERVDITVNQYYNTSLNGLPGNDDSGSMGAYAVWSHLGFFPVAGQDTYLLNRPYFPQIAIRNEVTGAVATIMASGLSDTNKYIQSATLDGKNYTKNWISHEFFTKGGTLKFVMGSSMSSSWGTAQEDLPMSLSTGGFGCKSCISPVGLSSPETSINEASSISKGGASAGGSSEMPGEPPKPYNFFSYLIFLLLAD